MNGYYPTTTQLLSTVHRSAVEEATPRVTKITDNSAILIFDAM